MGIEADCNKVVKESIDKLGGLDVIISNAVSSLAVLLIMLSI